eukprot:Pgem_evm1s9483
MIDNPLLSTKPLLQPDGNSKSEVAHLLQLDDSSESAVGGNSTSEDGHLIQLDGNSESAVGHLLFNINFND